MGKIFITLFLILTISLLSNGCFYPSSTEGKVALLSDKIGFSVSGPYGFYGTITKENITDEDWDFSGEFTFPNSLCFYLGSYCSIKEVYPESITIELYAKKSLLGELFAPDDKRVKVESKIKASSDAQFKVVFKTF